MSDFKRRKSDKVSIEPYSLTRYLAENSKLFMPIILALLGYGGYNVYEDVKPIVTPVEVVIDQPEQVTNTVTERIVTKVDNSSVLEAMRKHVNEYHK